MVSSCACADSSCCSELAIISSAVAFLLDAPSYLSLRSSWFLVSITYVSSNLSCVILCCSQEQWPGQALHSVYLCCPRQHTNTFLHHLEYGRESGQLRFSFVGQLKFILIKPTFVQPDDIMSQMWKVGHVLACWSIPRSLPSEEMVISPIAKWSSCASSSLFNWKEQVGWKFNADVTWATA